MNAEAGAHGLKANAVGFISVLVIGLASTAPAYSLAAVIGVVVVLVGVQAPAALLTSFIPMFFIAAAFYYMNRADPDCGTSFSWVTRAMGPWVGWMAGWAVCATSILVIGSLADVAARYTFLLFDLDVLAASKVAVTILAVLYIAVLTWIAVVGIELSARLQDVLIVAQVLALLLFASVALISVFNGTAPGGSLLPELAWFSPFAISSPDALIGSLLIGVFIYWGWESAVNSTEESTDSATTPGLAAICATIILLITYLSVSTAVVAFAGLATVEGFADNDTILSHVATDVLGSPWDKFVVLAVLTSALAATQTTIIPSSRTTLSMARARAMPDALARVHHRFQTPHIATIITGVAGIAWYVSIKFLSESFLLDTLSALSLLVAFYYSLSGFACVIYYRRELLKSARNFVFIGVAPMLGAMLLAYIFFMSMASLAEPRDSYTGAAVFGLGLPLVIGLGFLLLGLVLMILWRLMGDGTFFGRTAFQAVDPEVAAGKVATQETAGAPAGS
ncbi:MAG: APC family permease [Gammaproteobacteria bacterium]|nr:APC family permease [Gammaproteobacteria bacterium]